MTAIIVAMAVILSIALSTAVLVLIGIEGRGRRRAPRFAGRVARAAEHLNGEGQPPRRFVKLIEQSLLR